MHRSIKAEIQSKEIDKVTQYRQTTMEWKGQEAS